jgi:cell division protein FtsB
MAGTQSIRAALSALRHAPELRARIEALEAENRVLQQRIDDAIAIATTLRDEQRRQLLEEARRAHQPVTGTGAPDGVPQG